MGPTAENRRPNVAIACQGGGSHAAFAAGVLVELLTPQMPRPAGREIGPFQLIALTGTSGGAICAALAWSALVRTGGCHDQASCALEHFWRDLSTTNPVDFAINRSCLWMARLPVTMEISPYDYPQWSGAYLRMLLERHLRLDQMPADRSQWNDPVLFVGVTDIKTGLGLALPGEHLTYEHLLASAAVPPLFRAVASDGRYFWDGLFSRNPPICELTNVEPRPDEIWVIQINPQRCDTVPTRMTQISDRRNELTGNLSLNEELAFVDKINEIARKYPAVAADYHPITIRKVTLDLDLDYASKFDRGIIHIRRLMDHGKRKAHEFFQSDSVWRREEARSRGELSPKEVAKVGRATARPHVV